MINPDITMPSDAAHDEAVDSIVAEGPIGALVVAGIATFCVVALWLLFYALVFLPRSGMQ